MLGKKTQLPPPRTVRASGNRLTQQSFIAHLKAALARGMMVMVVMTMVVMRIQRRVLENSIVRRC